MPLQQALEQELADELAHVQARQENSLRRELERVDDYFENYERELNARAVCGSSQNGKTKATDRLAVAKAEHSRRRADQLARYEIRVHPHLDALLLIAEKPGKAGCTSSERTVERLWRHCLSRAPGGGILDHPARLNEIQFCT
jgi:hypothetical protein